LNLREKLEGTWIATAVTIDGKKCTGREIAKVRLTLGDHDDFKLISPMGEWTGLSWVNVWENPKRIYFVLEEPDSGTRLGIYEAEDDVLTICVNTGPGVEVHPADFTAKEGSGRMLLTLKRQEKER
jgi:uncharacterized protein (TIGR03067 family)